MRFPLVLFVARCLVFTPPSALRVIVVFGIVSVFRVRFTLVVFGRVSVHALSRLVVIVRVIAFRLYRSGGVRCPFVCLNSLVYVGALRSYIVPIRAEGSNRLRAFLRSFIRVSLLLHDGSFRSIVVRLFFLRVGACLWTFRYRFYRSIVVLLVR